MEASKSILIIFLSLFILAGCEKNKNVLQPPGQTSAGLGLDIQFPQKNKVIYQSLTSKRNINRITVRISGQGLESPRTEMITISGDTARKAITDLPVGNKEINVLASAVAGNFSFDLFKGIKNLNLTTETNRVIIPLNEIIATKKALKWHDGGFEDTRYASMGKIMAVGFNVSGISPVFLTTVSFNLKWEGHQGDYRIIVLDNFNNTPQTAARFRSDKLHAESDGWITWDLIWDTPSKGIFNSGMIIGFEYASNELWPDMTFDMSDSDTSFFFNNDSSQWYIVPDGDFGITCVVQTQNGQNMKLKPSFSLKGIMKKGILKSKELENLN